MLEVFTENVAGLHIKYLTENSVKNILSYPKLQLNQDLLTLFDGINSKYGKKLEDTLIKVRIAQIIRNVEDKFKKMSQDCLELVVYDFLNRLYNKAVHMENQCHMNSFIHLYFEKLEVALPHVTIDQIETLAKYFLPHIKLNAVINNVQKDTTGSRFLELQAFECIACPCFSREDCYQTVFKRIGNNDFELITFDLEPMAENMGFIGEHFNLKITIKHNKETKILHFFVKFILSKGETWKAMSMKAFKKEEFMYKTFIPLLNKYEIGELSSFAPNCYFTRTNDVIVLEDLKSLGFSTFDLREPVEFEWMVSIVRQLSRLHACSMLLDKKFSEERGVQSHVGDIFKEYLDEINFDKGNPDCRTTTFGGELISEYFVIKLPDICKNMPVEEFKRKAVIEVEKMYENLGRSKAFYNVICHRDLWGNNLLLNNFNDCVFVDYQMIRYCPPALDLVFLMYTNADKNFRLKHMDTIVNIYYEYLKENLNMYDVDINEFYTKQKFLESIRWFRPTSIVLSLTYLQLVLCPKDILDRIKSNLEVADKFYLEDRREVHDAAWNCETFNSRMRGLMEDLYEICEQQ